MFILAKSCHGNHQKRNKLRTFLTGFAVAWGIFGVYRIAGCRKRYHPCFRPIFSERVHWTLSFLGWPQALHGIEGGVSVWRIMIWKLPQSFLDYASSVAGATVRQVIKRQFGQEYVNISLWWGTSPNYTEVETVEDYGRAFYQPRMTWRSAGRIWYIHKAAEITDWRTVLTIRLWIYQVGNLSQIVGIYNDQGDREASEACHPFTLLCRPSIIKTVTECIIFTLRIWKRWRAMKFLRQIIVG